MIERIKGLSIEQLENLGEALLDFSAVIAALERGLGVGCNDCGNNN
ncbi:DUF4351 domain-containing protein [Nostoc sp. UHCC 0702]|nr:DUF4351 domain-containing protein [Nostoc sp. UHCC 0702]